MAIKTINKAVEELNKEYAEIYKNSASMYDYCTKQISNALELENGFIIEFRKRTIKKDFCFGAGQNGLSTDEDWKNAHDAVDTANNDSNYFIEENLKRAFSDYDKMLKDNESIDGSGHWGIYASSQRPNENIKRAYLIGERYCQQYEDKTKYYKLTDLDIENIKKVVEEEKEKFLKRLNTYLKKYGLSKVNSWSYLSD